MTAFIVLVEEFLRDVGDEYFRVISRIGGRFEPNLSQIGLKFEVVALIRIEATHHVYYIGVGHFITLAAITRNDHAILLWILDLERCKYVRF